DLAEVTFIDELLCQHHCRDFAIVKVHHTDGAGLSPCANHVSSFIERVCQWFLADDMFAGGEGIDHHLMMKMSGRGDIDDIDGLVGDEHAVVGFMTLPSELVGGCRDRSFVPTGNRDHAWCG